MIRRSAASRCLPVVALVASTLLLGVCNADEPFTATPDDLGKVCAFDTECIFACTGGVTGSHGFCTHSCDKSACPAGYACVARGRLGLVCAVVQCSGSTGCPADYTCYTGDDYQDVCRHVDIPCTSDTDCPGLVACNQGVCTLVCTEDGDCKQGYTCEGSQGCGQCHQPGDCENGFACVGGLCTPACATDYDCRAGFECTAAACTEIHGGGPGAVGADCTEDSECADFCYQDYVCGRLCNGQGDTTSCPSGSQCDGYQLVCRTG
jgi:hypothetical protein